MADINIIEGFIEIAKNTQVEETKRREALLQLKKFADHPQVIDLLLELSDDKQVSVRYFAKKIYNEIQAQKAKNLKIQQLKKRSSLYEKLPPGERVKEIKKAIENATHRKEVASLIIELGKTQDPTAAPILKEYLKSEWDRWRANAVEALAMIPGSDFIPWILEMKNDPDNRTRGNVAQFLWMKGEKEEALNILKDMVLSDQIWMKDSAIYVLKFIGNPKALELLKIAANDYNEEIRTKAKEAIEEIKNKISSSYKSKKKIISSGSKASNRYDEGKSSLLDKLKKIWKG